MTAAFSARTMDGIGDIGLDSATGSLVVPYPGTPLYARLQQEQRVVDGGWRHYNGRTHAVYRPKLVTANQAS